MTYPRLRVRLCHAEPSTAVLLVTVVLIYLGLVPALFVHGLPPGIQFMKLAGYDIPMLDSGLDPPDSRHNVRWAHVSGPIIILIDSENPRVVLVEIVEGVEVVRVLRDE